MEPATPAADDHLGVGVVDGEARRSPTYNARWQKMCINLVCATPQSQIKAHKHPMLTVACQGSIR
jgi:hypothetical protein